MSQVFHAVMPRRAEELPGLRRLPEGLRCAELRGDAYEGPLENLHGVLGRWREQGIESIFTLRTGAQGGSFRGTREELRRHQREAAAHADWIDVEWDEDAPPRADEIPARWVLSWHDFEGVPAELEKRAARMLEAAPVDAHVKLAVTPRDHDELCRLLELPGRHPGRKLSVLGMGARGLITRVMAPRTGCAISFGRPEGVEATGPGQPTTRELLDGYDFDSWTEQTRLGLVVGQPVAHSLSPCLHHAAYQALGIDRRMLPLEVDDFDQALSFARRWGVDAMAVTMPFKDAARAAARAFRPEADETERRAAANGLRRDGEGWIAANTDGDGVREALREAGAELRGARVLVLGAGGAARAAAAALIAAGAEVCVAARRPEAEPAVRAIGARFAPLAEVEVDAHDVVLNGTPLGMAADDPSPLEEDRLRAGQVVMDMIYRPVDTPLLRAARRRGARTVPGSAMFLHQAVHQIHWFVGREPPLELLRQRLRAALTPTAPLEDPPR